MGVAFISWGRFFDKRGNKITVPAPTSTPGAPWLWGLPGQGILALRQSRIFRDSTSAPSARLGAQQATDAMGMKFLIHVLNVDTFNVRTITRATSFGLNVQLHDYSGHQRDIWTGADGGGRATFTILRTLFKLEELSLFFPYQRQSDNSFQQTYHHAGVLWRGRSRHSLARDG
jgi:hypothetical protein